MKYTELGKSNVVISRICLGTMHFGGGPGVTTQTGDLAMAVIIRQTGQKLKDYGFYRSDREGPQAWLPVDIGPGAVGFDKDAKRRAARKKLRAWWQEHKKKYENVEKVPLADGGEDEGEERGGLPAFLRRLGGF